jgi:hypothetical protein
MNDTRPLYGLLRKAAVAGAALMVFLAWRVVDPPTYEVAYTPPASANRLIARFTPTHAYLAEYARSLAVVRSDGSRTEFPLAADTGGYSRAQLYQADDGTLYYKGYFDIARIDSVTGEVDVSSPEVPAGALYLGAFDYGRDTGWRFLLPAESPEQSMDASGG